MTATNNDNNQHDNNKHNKHTITVSGERMTPAELAPVLSGDFADLLSVEIKPDAAIKIGAERSATAGLLEIEAEDDDVVELTLDDDIQLYTSVGRLLQDFLADQRQRSDRQGSLHLPTRLQLDEQVSRGGMGIVIKALKLLDIKGQLIDTATTTAASLTACKLAEIMENRLVGEGGLFRIGLSRNGSQPTGEITPEPSVELQPSTNINVSKPMLVFVHGTASSTEGSFSALWENNQDNLWQQLQATYGENIFALQHRTLSQSPIANAVMLLESLPPNAELHLVTHSRGGLIGELLCRGQFSDGRAPFTQKDIELFTPNTDDEEPGSAADHQEHRILLGRLNQLLLDKQPLIKRFVRVACPARGTTLASGRLDLYLSGLLNIIGQLPVLKANPIYSFLKTFTLAVAKERTKPQQLPGLAAQMPGSPLIALLNNTPVTNTAPLTVIEGDIVAAGLFKKIALLFLDRFYDSDHDLVVNTPSMDGGAPRNKPVAVLFDQGKAVNHFSYFTNARTRQGMLAALRSVDSTPEGFELRQRRAPYIARTSQAPDELGVKPILLLLPGLSGSHLSHHGKKIWVSPFNLLRGRFTRLSYDAQGVVPTELVDGSYANLANYMAQSHEVVEFPYDWRRPVAESGRALARLVQQYLRDSERPIRIIAHSMGGLIFRSMAAEAPDLWTELKARDGSRVLMLGTPNRGSHSITRIFARQDRLIRTLAAVDLRNNQDELLAVISRFQGLLDLLPLDDDNKIHPDAIWGAFERQLGPKWQRPLKTALEKAQRHWNAIDGKGLDSTHVFYIAGQAKNTPVSVRWQNTIEFLASSHGDGQVPWSTGIPGNINHWFVDAVHGEIPEYQPGFKGMLEILTTGTTQLLTRQPTLARADEAERLMLPDKVDVYPTETMIEAAALGKRPYGGEPASPRAQAINISVIHGNLCFSTFPVAVGHYQGDTIVSAEAALDRRLSHRLSKRLQLGFYPGPLSTNEILFKLEGDHFPGAVIVGLGEVGDLTPGDLTDSFREAALRFVVNGREQQCFNHKEIKLSTLLLGTGGGGISVEDAMTAMLRGVAQANRLLAGPEQVTDNCIRSLNFIELYEDLAVGALHILRQLEQSPEFRGAITIDPYLAKTEGGQRRICFTEDPDWWQRLRIETQPDGSLKFTSLTSRDARAPMRTQPCQWRTIAPFLNTMTQNTSSDAKLGRALFELLIPSEFKAMAAEQQDLLLVVDHHSAVYPWELLEYAGHEGDEPLAKRAGMIRQLASVATVKSNLANNHRALVVGDPKVNNEQFVALPGAREEAALVHQLLKEKGYATNRSLLQRVAGSDIITALMTGEYQILHLAGHGVVEYVDPDDTSNRIPGLETADDPSQQPITGMVIGDSQYLTAIELNSMPATPAFVFVNCCHLGNTNVAGAKHNDSPHLLAANLAIQLIRQGVRAVIAAGWAVDDAAAQTFARTFYSAFLSGRNFGDSVKAARQQTYEHHPNVNTWGAYQCYGDPGYSLDEVNQEMDEFVCGDYVSCQELVTDIDNISERARSVLPERVAWLSHKLSLLVGNIPQQWTTHADVQQALGFAWGELDDFERAIDAFQRVLDDQSASLSLRGIEQLANFEARHAVTLFEQGKQYRSRSPLQLANEAIKRLAGLNGQFGETAERLALTGSAYKRRAQITRYKKQQLFKALTAMADAYQRAHHQAIATKGQIDPYPVMNWLTARWLLSLETTISNDLLGDVSSLLEQTRQECGIAADGGRLTREQFWGAIADNDCRFLLALVRGELGEHKEQIAEQYRTIRRVASSPRQFRSVIEHLQFVRQMLVALNSEVVAEDVQDLLQLLE